MAVQFTGTRMLPPYVVHEERNGTHCNTIPTTTTTTTATTTASITTTTTTTTTATTTITATTATTTTTATTATRVGAWQRHLLSIATSPTVK
jgi:hypothetical protein